MSYTITVAEAQARATRNVPGNPRPLCRDFQAQPAPAAYWCTTCHWNEPMHDSEIQRDAIAKVLANIQPEEQQCPTD
jgi:hypothetical protein